MKMQLNITLRYSIINKLIIKERIYLNVRERYNITQKDDENNETIKTTRQVKSFFRFFIFSFLRKLFY